MNDSFFTPLTKKIVIVLLLLLGVCETAYHYEWEAKRRAEAERKAEFESRLISQQLNPNERKEND